jgi:hypothetical protein
MLGIMFFSFMLLPTLIANHAACGHPHFHAPAIPIACAVYKACNRPCCSPAFFCPCLSIAIAYTTLFTFTSFS